MNKQHLEDYLHDKIQFLMLSKREKDDKSLSSQEEIELNRAMMQLIALTNNAQVFLDEHGVLAYMKNEHSSPSL